jgi:hypothetical protein
MTYQNFASLGVNLNRQKYGPLDISNVFTSENDLNYYLTRGTHTEGVSEYWYKNAKDKVVPYPYEGQVLATAIDGTVSIYKLVADSAAGVDKDGVPLKFITQEIAGKIEVDGNTIKLNTDGKLELASIPTDANSKTLVPSLVNGTLTWAEPDTSTAEGQSQEIAALKERASQLETTVNGRAKDEENNVEAVVGLVTKVADETTAREAADAVLDGKIADALAAAKKYADDNDADTIYNDTELRGKISALEGINADTRLKLIEAFFEAADYDGEDGTPSDESVTLYNALDTLKEIQDFLGSEGGAADVVAQLQSNVTLLMNDASEPGSVANTVKKAVDSITGDLPEGTTATLASLNSAISANTQNIANQTEDITGLKNAVIFTEDDFYGEHDGITVDIVTGFEENSEGKYVPVTEKVDWLYNDVLYNIANVQENDPIKRQILENTVKIHELDTRAIDAVLWANEVSVLHNQIDAEAEALAEEFTGKCDELSESIAKNAEDIKTLNETAVDTTTVNGLITSAIEPLTNETTGIKAQAVAEAVSQAAVDTQTKVSALANGAVSKNTQDIAALTGQVEGINASISSYPQTFGQLRAKDAELSSRIDGLNTSISNVQTSINTRISKNSSDIATIQRDLTSHTESSSAYHKTVNDSLADRYTKAEVDALITNIDTTDLEEAIEANTTAISNEKTRAETEDARLAGLINTANENIAALQTLINNAIENDTEALDSITEIVKLLEGHGDVAGVVDQINANTDNISTLMGGETVEGSVKKIVSEAVKNSAPAIATATALGVVKADAESGIGVDTTGALYLSRVSTDLLSNGSYTLVLNGGTATDGIENTEPKTE